MLAREPGLSYKNYTRELDQAYGVLGSHNYFQRIKASVLLRVHARWMPQTAALMSPAAILLPPTAVQPVEREAVSAR